MAVLRASGGGDGQEGGGGEEGKPASCSAHEGGDVRRRAGFTPYKTGPFDESKDPVEDTVSGAASTLAILEAQPTPMSNPKKAPVFLLAVLVVSSALAQDVKESDVSPATRRYREYRLQTTEPSFGLRKVKALMKGIKPDQEDNARLASTAYNRLTTAERFTFCMIHPEAMSQNCDGMPWVVDEDRKIFAYPPSPSDAVWSDRQLSFLHDHRSEVVRLLRTTIRSQSRVGGNLKQAIIEIRAVELIPDLIAAYNRDRKDQDILSTLMVLMKEGKDKPFSASATYRKLYGPDASYQAFVIANPANQKLTVDRATAFYRSRMKR